MLPEGQDTPQHSTCVALWTLLFHFSISVKHYGAASMAKTKLQLRETKIVFQEVLQAAQHKVFHEFYKAWEKGNRPVAQHYSWIFVWLQDWAGNALLPCFPDYPCAPAVIKQGKHFIYDSGWKLFKEDVHHSIMTLGRIFEVMKSHVKLFQNEWFGIKISEL
jgi:hypothetical protein